MNLKNNKYIMKHLCICQTCGFEGYQKTFTKGSFIMELFLWLVFLFPGVIYSIWRLTSRYSGCPSCENNSMIPVDSPHGRKLYDLAKN